jgi:HSP20 family protein
MSDSSEEVNMSLTLMPWRKKTAEQDPFAAMRQEMDKIFERFGSGFELAPFEGKAIAEWSPKVNVSETEKEVLVTAELPGIEEKDVEVTLDNGVLAIKGEKKAEKEEKNKNYHRIERSYGSFVRSIALPHEVEEEKVEATFKNGVLTVKLPKTPAGGQEDRHQGLLNGNKRTAAIAAVRTY